MLEKDHLNKILDESPGVDRAAVDRARQAAKQLADVGIKVGEYRLEPALGGPRIKLSGQTLRRTRNR